ncbi:MAG TPA: dephospho-CoA kinase [Solirubrobacteraceae bacterium]|nr:dephospho-CoA kinase [Solirubrobacteraceae bacterium]
MPLVGLTGGLGAGKSTALEQCAMLGAAILSTDGVVHELYATDALIGAVRERFGEEVFDSAGNVDRRALGERVFAEPERREWLERLLWPLVAERTRRWHSELERLRPPPRAAVVETPLLFEAGGEGRFAATIAVVADDELRAARVAGRDQAALEQRERRQLSQEEKAARATYVVVNDGTVEELRERLASILETIAG